MVEIARKSNRYKVLTKNTYKNTVMKESQVSAMEEFIENITILINALGYKVLEPIITRDTDQKGTDKSEEYHITVGTAKATGVVTSEGFVVYKGAVASAKIRDSLLSSGKVKDWITTEDILFSSSSPAAVFVLGYNVSGPQTWKNKDGKTLKEVEESKTGT